METKSDVNFMDNDSELKYTNESKFIKCEEITKSNTALGQPSQNLLMLQ